MRLEALGQWVLEGGLPHWPCGAWEGRRADRAEGPGCPGVTLWASRSVVDQSGSECLFENSCASYI